MQARFLAVVVFVLTIVSTVAITLLVKEGNGKSPDAVSSVADMDANQDALEKAVKSYITKNPEEVLQTLILAQQLQQQKAEKAAQDNIVNKRDALEHDKNSPSYGNRESKIVIVKFNDYNCGFCKRVAPDMETLVQQDKDVKIVVKEFPILSPFSITLAKASVVFYRLAPEKFEEFHVAMLKTTPRDEAQISALSSRFGVNGADLEAEMKKPEVAAEIDSTQALGREIGVRGTPAFVINGKFYRGAISLDEMKAAIKEARG